MRKILFLIFCCLPYLAQGQLGPDRPMDFKKLEGKKLDRALKQLDKLEGYAFSYNPDAIDTLTVSPEASNAKSIDQFLTACLAGTELDFTFISGVYVIFPIKEAPNSESLNRKEFALSGIVRDKETREALPYAGITILNNGTIATTNTDGKFTLLKIPSDTSLIKVTYLGYSPLILTPKNNEKDGVLIAEMVPLKKNLPSVQITASSQELIEIENAPGRITLNTVQISKLPNLGENDLYAALRKLPGIKSGSSTSSGLSIRGGGTDQNLVIFDGITVYHVDHFYGFLSAFNTNMVKNVQVEKGGFRAKYGGRASGVINITGIDGNKVEPSFLLEANLLSANFRAELPIVPEKASLVIAYRRAFTDIIQTPTYQNMFNNIFNSSIPGTDENNTNVFETGSEPDFTYYDLNAKFNFRPSEKDAISISYYEGRDDVSILFDGNFQNLRRLSQDQTDWGTQGGSFKWSRKWNKRFFTYANYGISLYSSNLDAEESYFFTDSDTLLSTLFFDQRTSVRDNSLRIDNTLQYDSKTKIDFGLWHSDYRIELQSQNQNSVLLDSLQSASLTAGYFEAEKAYGSLSINAGIRLSYYTELNTFYPEPRLSLSYKVNEKFRLKGAYGIFHQIIRRLNERSLYLSIPETWTLASENTVPALRSDHYIAGFTAKHSGWELDFEAYHKYERGAVEYLFPQFGFATGDLDLFSVDGNRTILGVDVLLKKNFRNKNFIIGYSYLNARSKYPGINNGNYFRSAGSAAHEFNLVYNYEWKRWDFSLAFLIASGEPYTPVLGTFIVELPNGEEEQFVSIGEINSERLDFYHRLDLSIGYTLPIKKGVFQVGLSAYNLYNNLAVNYVDYFQIPRDDSPFYNLGQRDIFSLGFTPSLFLKLKI